MNVPRIVLEKKEKHPTEGSIIKTRPANIFSGGNRSNDLNSPILGQDTEPVLSEIGYSENEIKNFLKSGAIFSSPVFREK